MKKNNRKGKNEQDGLKNERNNKMPVLNEWMNEA